MGEIRTHRSFRGIAGAAMAALALAACASSTPNDTAPGGSPDTLPSDMALLDDSSEKPVATEVSDSSAFADLESLKDKKEDSTPKGPKEPESPVAEAPADGSFYYDPVGGESLGRVAFTLYSDRGFVTRLLEKNPELKGVRKLSAGQKVFFEMQQARPEPRFLTKDLLQRYAAPLAERILSTSKSGKTSVTLEKGESLQDLSQRLYGTHRLWTEIYLVNQDKIQNYDKVKAGLTLTVFEHAGFQKAAGKSPEASEKVAAAPARTETKRPPPMDDKTPVEAKPLPAVSPSVALPIQTEPEPAPLTTQPTQPPVASQPPPDPIPETSPAVGNPLPAEPSPQTLSQAPLASEPAQSSHEPIVEASSPVNFRRILYVVLVLLIGGSAYYFTRTPKRPKSDLLDLNAEAGVRPKLASKDTQSTQTG